MEKPTKTFLVRKGHNVNSRKRKYADESNAKLSKINIRHSMKHASSCNLICIKDAFDRIPYKFYMPLPVVYPLLEGRIMDSALELICRKEEYQTSIDSIKAIYNTATKKKRIVKAFACYEKMQKLLNDDPDRYFCCNYNWYYTGGNLNTHYINDTVFLIHATNNKELSTTEVQKQKNEWKVEWSKVLCDEPTSIFQIDSTLINEHSVTCVRRKLSISVYNISFENLANVTCKLQKYIESDIPFVSVGVNKYSLNEYATVNVKSHVKIYDTCTGKEKITKRFPYKKNVFEGNHFGQLKYYNQNVLAYLNKSEFNLLDLRTKDKCTLLRDTILFEANVFANVSLTKDSYCYISTVRDVLQVDLRNMSIVKRWNHSLSSAPILSDSICNDNDSILCISSSKPEEKLVLGQNEPRIFVPKYLPTLAKAIESATLQEPHISASNRFTERLNLSTTGLSILPGDAGAFTVFAANSLGDVFNYEAVNHQTPEEDNWNANKFQELIKSTNKYGMKEQLNYFDKVVLKDIKIDIHEDVYPQKSFNAKRLAFYCDDLKQNTVEFVSKLSDAWYDNGIQSLKNIEELPSEVNISQWLSHLSEAAPDEV